MSFQTYEQGLSIAQTAAQKAVLAESSLTKLAPLASPLPTLNKAFPLYIAAAEAYSHLVASSLVPPTEIPNVKKKWRLVLERAEKVKRRVEELGGQVSKASIGDEGQEAAIIRGGGRINGVQLDVWREPADWEFELEKGGLFRDPNQPSLPADQEEGAKWADSSSAVWTRATTEEAVVVRQGVGADCSVAAGLTVCLDHNRRWASSLGTDGLYPQTASGHPRNSANGRHVLKLLMNGCWRSLVIDALLPVHASNQSPVHATLHSLDDQGERHANPAVALTVKGLLKALGGYDILGSNPSLDVYALTGWLPERLDLRASFQREKEWQRIYEAWRKGQVLVTLGTGSVPGSSLVALHAYSVLSGERLLDIYDPGFGSSVPDSDPVPNLDRLTISNSPSGVVRMSWDDLCTSFDELDLNWDPALRPVTAIKNWYWPKPDAIEPVNTSSKGVLRYELTYDIPEGTDIWFLLSQHVSSKDRPLEDIALHVYEDSAPVQRHHGESAGDTCGSVPYSNSLHVLYKARPQRSRGKLSVSPARDRGVHKTSFTLQAFASKGSSISLDRVTRSLPHNLTVAGSLTSRNAGGHSGLPSFMYNPQYALRIEGTTANSAKASLRLSLTGEKAIPWQVVLVWGNGKRVFELGQQDVLASSGPYSHGMAYCEVTDVQPGVYTLVVSAFEADMKGPYDLVVESTLPVMLQAIPLEGAGMFLRSIPGRWTSETAGGRPSAGTYHLNPQVELIIPQSTSLMARLHLPTPAPIPVNLTLFKRSTGSSLGEQMATTGPYADNLSGVAIEKTKLEAGVYLAIPSGYQAGLLAEWRLDFWADGSFSAELQK